jgi:hypothetical protein
MEPSKLQKWKGKTAIAPMTIPAERVDRCPVCVSRSRREWDTKWVFSEFETIDVDADVIEREDSGAFW